MSHKGELMVIHARKRFIEGHEHFDGTVSVFNAHQTDILDDALRFSKLRGPDGILNYTVVAVVILGYANANPNVWCDNPTHEVARWDNVA